jgi:hypothetical protein
MLETSLTIVAFASVIQFLTAAASMPFSAMARSIIDRFLQLIFVKKQHILLVGK